MSLKKLALLVGNAKYNGNMLKNPVHDAKDLSQKLNFLGFQTLMGINTTREELKRLLLQFQQELTVTDIGLFFFAGHGMQIKGENYITCTDTSFTDEIAADCSSIPLKQIVHILDNGKNRTNIIILDACRDNPFERAWNRGVNQQGLAPVVAPRGTIIAFATSPGKTASDGEERNGVYTSSILKHIEEQNLPIEEMFKRVRNTVSVMTNGKQTSWEHTSLMGSFFFNSSIPDEQNIAVYSENAKADAEFVPIEGNELIKALKSCDWRQQNPAIIRIENNDFSSFDKNTLFVVGRNIYQTACGPSFDGESLINNLKSFLNKFSNEVSFHILNGILYEIYFDSAAQFRKIPKNDRFNEVLSLEEVEDFSKSFSFIQTKLKPHEDYLFYIPGIIKNISLDISISKDKENRFLIEKIHHEGENVLFEDTDSIFYSPNQEMDRLTFKTWLSRRMMIPINRLKLKFNPDVLSSDILLYPREHIISRFSL